MVDRIFIGPTATMYTLSLLWQSKHVNGMHQGRNVIKIWIGDEKTTTIE